MHRRNVQQACPSYCPLNEGKYIYWKRVHAKRWASVYFSKLVCAHPVYQFLNITSPAEARLTTQLKKYTNLRLSLNSKSSQHKNVKFQIS